MPGVDLMEAAGTGTANHIHGHAGLKQGDRVAILCGTGNNGGDGFVVARLLAGRGCEVSAYLIGDPERVRGDARINLDRWRAGGGSVEVLAGPDALAATHARLASAAVRVDALLGTGLTDEVRGLHAQAIDLLNDLDDGITAAVDLPSGVCADTGRVLGRAVRADLTVTFAHWKRGLALEPGASLSGDIKLVDIGIPASLSESTGASCELLDGRGIRATLPARPRTAHKGTFGHLLLISGSPGKSGAALLACKSALRAGCGLATLAADERTGAAAATYVPEAMSLSADLGRPGALAQATAGKAAVACGPGIGLTPANEALVTSITRGLALPVLLDADALTLLARDPGALRGAPGPRVLTPHPGEMARLIGGSTADIARDRLGIAERFSAEHGAIVLLKGARTVVAAPDGRLRVVPTGGPGLATAGSGDVLTGLIGSLLAQGMDAFEAACAGAYLHGLAGDLAEAALGPASVIASDIVDHLPGALAGGPR